MGSVGANEREMRVESVSLTGCFATSASIEEDIMSKIPSK
jgi:hypothetical protein